MSTVKNCHYVSKFLSRHWAIGARKKHRIATYIDLEDRTFEEDEVENIFALPELNSPEIEELLNRLIETPIGDHRKKLIEEYTLDITQPVLLRALRLFPIIQQLRFLKAKGEPLGNELDELLKLTHSVDERAMTEWAENQNKHTKIVRFRLRENDLCFMPERGIFRIPCIPKDRENNFPTWAEAFPLHPNVIISFLPDGMDLALMSQLPLSAYSASTYGGCKRFIVPPEILQTCDKNFILEEFIRLRDVVEVQSELIDDVQYIRQKMRELLLRGLTETITQDEISEIVAQSQEKTKSVQLKEVELLKRRDALHPDEKRLGHVWPNWKKTV